MQSTRCFAANVEFQVHLRHGVFLNRLLFVSFRPVTHAWEGGAALSKTDVFVGKMCVTKAEYDEHGKNICREKFDS